MKRLTIRIDDYNFERLYLLAKNNNVSASAPWCHSHPQRDSREVHQSVPRHGAKILLCSCCTSMQNNRLLLPIIISQAP